MAFFEKFPLVFYDLTGNKPTQVKVVTDVLSRIKMLSSIKDQTYVYYTYDVQDGDTPEIIASKYYDNPNLHWIILLANDIIDPIYDWPLTSRDFESYINDKYGSFSTASTQVHHYEKIITKTDSVTQNVTENKYQIDANTFVDSVENLIYGTEQLYFSWGRNSSGELGDGTTIDRSSPGSVLSGTGVSWCQASSSFFSTFMGAVKKDGTLWTWGNNSCGELGDGTTIDRSSPVTVAGGGTTWCQASFGGLMSSAVKTDGTLWTWGSGSSGGIGNNVGSEKRSSPGTISGNGTTWCQTSSGLFMIAAIKTDGTLWTWGSNDFGALGDGTTINRSSPVTVAGGGTTWCQVTNGGSAVTAGFGLAIKNDGSLWSWGNGNSGVLGDNCTTARSSPVQVSGGCTNWCLVSAGGRSVSAIQTNGTLWTWGRSSFGRLGNNCGSVCRSSPGTVAGGGNTWCNTATGYGHVGAVKTDGTLWTWGNGSCGALGNNSTINVSSPISVVGSWTKVFPSLCSTFAFSNFEMQLTLEQAITQSTSSTPLTKIETINLVDGNTVKIVTTVKPVYSYDYELELNESKRKIKIIDKRYITQIENELTNLLNNNGR